ncbi:MAG: hypothetical protein S4CHLAM45_10200 [Chlamydiales bacterium]|nr:hypothetical protein [Chlamydiales bacterium]MCH9619515.1 hypothetical protein [Chlamydiales bacterium]MCH9623121.1 hypothetical protein [Chlamydiales bacterium]
MRCIFTLFLLFSTLFGDVVLDHLESKLLQNAPTETACPKVDVMTGTYIEDATDLIVAGNDPLSIRRFYYHSAKTNDTRYGFWHLNPETNITANFEYNKLPKFASVGHFSGGLTQLHSIDHQKFGLIKNEGAGYNGQSHPSNIKLTYSKIWDPDNNERFLWQGKVIDGSGTVREFNKGFHCWHKENKKADLRKKKITGKLNPKAWIPYQLEVKKERRPNGNIIIYEYTNWRKGKPYPWPTLLKEIALWNSSETKKLAQINFTYDTYTWKFEQKYWTIRDRRYCEDDYREFRGEVRKATIEGSDGRQVVYINSRRERDFQPVVLKSITTPKETHHLDYHDYFLTNLKKDGHYFRTEYDSQGRVAAQYSPAGLVAKYIYHSNTTEVIDGEGHTTCYYFDTRINCIERENSIEVNTWDSQTGNLLSKAILDRDGNEYLRKEYTYDKNHNPITETIGDHTVYRTFSDDGFNLLLEEREDNKITKYTYKSGTNLTTSISIFDHAELKLQTRYFYDDCATCIKTIEEDLHGYCKTTLITPIEQNPCIGLPHIVEDGNGKIVYTYAPSGQVLREDHYDSNGAYCYAITNTYDKKERVKSTTNPLGEITTYDYDSRGNLITIKNGQTIQTFTYDAANRPIAISDGETTITKKYDTLGRVICQTDGCGFETQYTYDAAGNRTSILHPDGALEMMEYDPLGNVTKKTDPNGNITQTTYNHWCKPLTITYPDNTQETFTYHSNGTLASHTTPTSTKYYSYDIFDNIIKITEGEKVTQATYAPYGKLSQMDPEGVTTTYTYDTIGRKISESIGERKINYTYDTLGRLTETHCGDIYTIEEFDYLDRLISRKTNHTFEQFAYDINGNQTEVTNSKGTIYTNYNSQNQPVKVIDSLGKVTTYTYSYAGGLTITKREPNSRVTIQKHDCRGREVETIREGQHFTTTYDLNGNPIQRSYNSITHTWTYDCNNKIASCIEGGEKRTLYQYDKKGRLQALIKPNATIFHSYDAYGRLANLRGLDFDYHYTYDLCDRLIAVSDGTKRSYDLYGNLVKEELANGYTISNTFDPQGRRTRLTLPDQSYVDYSYSGDFLQSVTRNGQTHTYERDLDGYLFHSTLPYNLGNLDIKRDALSRCINLTSPFYTAANTFDISNNLTHCQSIDPLGPRDLHYTYNRLDQLTKEDNHTYRYDVLYNRIEKDGETHSYNNLCQNKDYIYDSNGNLLYDGNHTYTYDALDRLTSVDDETYTYDNFHRRMTSNQIPFIWDDKQEIGCPTELRVLGEGLGADIGAALFIEINGQTYIPIHNTIGSLAVLINPQKQSAETYRYTAYGEELTNSKTSPWRFASKRIDSTRLVYFGRRYYSPSQGRWITPDPLGFEDGPNLYAYVHNCPLANIDFHGLYNLSQCTGDLTKFAFRGLEWTGANLVPIPGIQSLVESIGRWGAGGDLFGPSRYRSGTHEIITIPGKTISGRSYTQGNGMVTTKSNAIAQAEYVSTTHGGAQVDLLYHGTNGLARDLISCGLAKLGIPNSYNKMCANYYNDKLKDNPNHRFTSSVHSRGGTQIMNTGKMLAPWQRQQIDVIAYGSATLIPRDYFRTAQNNISSLDMVTMTNPLAFCVGLINKNVYNVNFLSPSTRCPYKAHGFLESTYAAEIAKKGYDFQEKYFNE